jgi:hypothetical protein
MVGYQFAFIFIISCFVITTSDFHKERVSKIFDGIFYNFNETTPIWNLSISNNCIHCWNDDVIHMQNVGIDIKNAVHIVD